MFPWVRWMFLFIVPFVFTNLVVFSSWPIKFKLQFKKDYHCKHYFWYIPVTLRSRKEKEKQVLFIPYLQILFSESTLGQWNTAHTKCYHNYTNNWSKSSGISQTKCFVLNNIFHAALGVGMLSEAGRVTERSNSSEKTSPRKCERTVFADACQIVSKTTCRVGD